MNNTKILELLRKIKNNNAGELTDNEYENDIYSTLILFEAYVFSKSEDIRKNGLKILNKKALDNWNKEIINNMKYITELDLKKNKLLYKRYTTFKEFYKFLSIK